MVSAVRVGRWFRQRLTPVALVVLIAVAALGLPHAEDGHDADCTLVAVAHDASAHRVGAASTHDVAPPVHCLACHWLRALSRPCAARQVERQAASHIGLRSDAPALPAFALDTRPPLRGPPSFLTTLS